MTHSLFTQAPARIAAVIAGVALVASSFVAFTPSAGAQSTATNAQIQALLARVAQLQAQLAALRGGSAAFTMDLTVGSSGAEVTRLQTWLIGRGHAIPAGATGYFGEQTRVALAAYQSANGITPAAGYFGPLTRANVNSKLVTVPPTTPPTNNDDDEDEDDNDDLSGGAALLSGARIEEGDDEEVEIGSSGEVAEITFDVEDGDVRVETLELAFMAASGNDEDEPWNVFETITIHGDGDELVSEDVSDEADWEESDDEPYVFRFTGLDYVVREDDEASLTIEVEVNDDVQDGDDWSISIENDAIEAVDSTDDDLTTDGSGEVTFAIVEEASNADDDDDNDVVEASARVTDVSGQDNDYATFEITVSLEAIGEDIFIPRDADDAFTYDIVDSNGNVVGASTNEATSLSSTADREGNYYVVREDDTEEFTFVVVFDPQPSDEGKNYKLQLKTIEFNDSAASPDESWNARPESKYDTDFVYIND